MANSHNQYRNIGSMGICGIGVGILLGLSVSPAIQSVLSSVVAIIITGAGILTGFERSSVETSEPEDGKAGSKEAAHENINGVTDTNTKPNNRHRVSRTHVDPAPLAGLVAGIVIGSLVGVTLRTNEFLSPNLDMFVSKWKRTGLSEEELSRRLFDQLYGSSTVGKPDPANPDLNHFVVEWKKTGLSEQEISRRLFDKLYESVASKAETNPIKGVEIGNANKTGLNDPAIARLLIEHLAKLQGTPSATPEKEKPKDAVAESKPNVHIGGLFALRDPDECLKYRNRLNNLEELKDAMIHGKYPAIASFAQKCKDPDDLKLLVEEILCPEGKH
jgi:hypothetical protein